jgi:hypothetical protein
MRVVLVIHKSLRDFLMAQPKYMQQATNSLAATVRYKVSKRSDNRGESRALADGRVGIAYAGGGDWMAVCHDDLSHRLMSTRFRITKNGHIMKYDQKSRREVVYGIVGLDQKSVEPVAFDLVSDRNLLRLLLSSCVEEHHTELLTENVYISLDIQNEKSSKTIH